MSCKHDWMHTGLRCYWCRSCGAIKQRVFRLRELRGDKPPVSLSLSQRKSNIG